MWGNLLKASGYAFALREAAGLVTKSRTQRMKELRRNQYINIAIGASLGTALGVATGILMAPESGREIRSRIAGQTSSAVDRVKENVYRSRANLEKNPRFRSAAQSAEEAKEAVKEAAERAQERRAGR